VSAADTVGVSSKSGTLNLQMLKMIVPEGGFGKRLDEMYDWHQHGFRETFRTVSQYP
jgi:hypothetical protein